MATSSKMAELATTAAHTVMSEVDTLHGSLLPPPEPALRAEMPRRWFWLPLLIVAGLISVVIFGAGLIKVDYFAVAPGDAQPIAPRIEIKGHETFPAQGQVLFVTVGVPPLTMLGKLMGELQSNVEVVPKRQILGDESESQNRQENLQLMSYSKDFAAFVALRKLGYKVDVTGGGVVVDTTCMQASSDGKTCVQDSPAGAVLKHDDIITAIDDVPVNVVPDLADALAGKKPGDIVQIAIKRGATQTKVPLTLSEGSGGRTIVGIYPNPSPPDTIKFQFPFDVSINSGQVGGPSAGLAFTLALLDALTPGDLTGGVKVAATGEIDPSGDVEAIGGIRQKTVAVMRAGAKVFLVPNAANEAADAADEAKGHDLKVIGVNSVDEALKTLADLGGNALQLGTPGATS
jgi:Lon-like protease